MQNALITESLGARIIAAARMAVELHLQLDAQATIGGTDRDVTEDTLGKMQNDECRMQNKESH